MADPSSTGFWDAVMLLTPIASPVVSVLAMCVSGFIAWTAIKTPQRDLESKNHMDQAVLALGRAYEALTNDGKTIAPVESNRLNWLTAARHIEAYKVLKRGITEPSHLAMCEDSEEYWRHRLYLAINMHQIHDVGYYQEDRAQRKSQLDIPSLIIVYGFISWPDGKEDLVSKADLAGIVKRHDIRRGNLGLRRYIEMSRRWQALFDGANDADRTEQPAFRAHGDLASSSFRASGSASASATGESSSSNSPLR